jgi:hypothetical protein
MVAGLAQGCDGIIAIIIVPAVPCKSTQKKSRPALKGAVLAGWFL